MLSYLIATFLALSQPKPSLAFEVKSVRNTCICGCVLPGSAAPVSSSCPVVPMTCAPGWTTLYCKK